MEFVLQCDPEVVNNEINVLVLFKKLKLKSFKNIIGVPEIDKNIWGLQNITLNTWGLQNIRLNI